MSLRRQTRLIELQRRIRIAVGALQSVEQYLAQELEVGTPSAPDDLADRVRHATKAAISRAKAQ